MPTAAEIFASALEESAQAQEQGAADDLEARLAATRRAVVAMNDIPRPIFNLAVRFWKEWAHASQREWRYHAAIGKDDWPDLAREIARHVRTGTLPQNRLIIHTFMRNRSRLLWRDLKELFSELD